MKHTISVGLRRPPRALCRTSKYTGIEIMRSATFTVRVDAAAKKRLERFAKNTGRGRSFLTAEAINEYLDDNEWRAASSRFLSAHDSDVVARGNQ